MQMRSFEMTYSGSITSQLFRKTSVLIIPIECLLDRDSVSADLTHFPSTLSPLIHAIKKRS